MPRLPLALLAVISAVLAVSCGESRSGLIDVRVGDLTIRAEVARSPEERALGLGGRDSMPSDAGMLFVFEQAGQPSFWMRGMRFPLDFVWISADLRVADVTERVPPEPGTPDAELTRYPPDAPVLYVLEINAGLIEQAGIRAGDAVAFDPEPPAAVGD